MPTDYLPTLSYTRCRVWITVGESFLSFCSCFSLCPCLCPCPCLCLCLCLRLCLRLCQCLSLSLSSLPMPTLLPPPLLMLPSTSSLAVAATEH